MARYSAMAADSSVQAGTAWRIFISQLRRACSWEIASGDGAGQHAGNSSCLATGRLCRVLGWGTFSRSSPFGHWYEDVRALGFLRLPWGLAYDNLFMASLAAMV